jgi:aminopeptidase
MKADERLERYADLAVRVGANVQPGQDVVVYCLVEHAQVARAVARAAYGAGARRVIPWYRDLHFRRAAVELGPPDELGWSLPTRSHGCGTGPSSDRH